jgi:ferritin-like metal-binding protein YciE
MNNLQDLYLHKLEMAYDIESKLVTALDELSSQATNSDLKSALMAHLAETRQHFDSVSGLLNTHGITPSADLDFFSQMINHTNEMLAAATDPAAVDTLIIASGQSVEHLEMALYGTLAEWADELDLDDDKEVLERILDQEKAADKKLNGIATGSWFKDSINEVAA